jgi:hypothetical protein
MQFFNATVLAALLTVAACAPSSDTNDAAGKVASQPAKPSAGEPVSSPGKPSAPISIRYKILGTPVVGQPVAIEIGVASSLQQQPLRISYKVLDADSLSLPESQPASTELSAPADGGFAARQVTVVPLREGRLYLNVTAEIATDEGMVLKSMAVPIAVGRATTAPAINGELRQAADGETVISMPAREN